MQQIIFYYWTNSKIPKVPSSDKVLHTRLVGIRIILNFQAPEGDLLRREKSWCIFMNENKTNDGCDSPWYQQNQYLKVIKKNCTVKFTYFVQRNFYTWKQINLGCHWRQNFCEWERPLWSWDVTGVQTFKFLLKRWVCGLARKKLTEVCMKRTQQGLCVPVRECVCARTTILT